MTRFLGLAPVLLVADVAAALAWYRDVLGCETEPWHGEPSDYGYVTRDGCSIHLARGEPPLSHEGRGPFDVYLWVDDVDALHSQLVARGADVLHGPTERPWRMREIRVRDLDGHVLGIGQPL
jgi:catechol 2,3-dioxygenase-like lactoylglutathione lyase family enzyme